MIGVSAEPIVVKLGGSNAGAPEMDIWLAALVESGWPVVIVPGGGPFADFIRDVQPRLDFPTFPHTRWQFLRWNSSAICWSIDSLNCSRRAI